MQTISDLSPGFPQPFGLTKFDGGLNFSLFSRHAASVTLCFFSHEQNLVAEIALDPSINRTGDVWHILCRKIPPEIHYYAYRIDGPEGKDFKYDRSLYLIDPYSKELSTSNVWGANSNLMGEKKKFYAPLGAILDRAPFDWQGTVNPRIPLNELIIYEMHVRGFTIHPSSKVNHPGTFLGVIEKIPYLLGLGINAVELLPVQEFDENEVQRYSNPAMRSLCNYWGYSTINFFSPMRRYASTDSLGASIVEFKTMVRELHRNGIEVILDVVFNHTGEGNEEGPVLSFKGIDNPIYYILNKDDPTSIYSNYTGCGNTFNCNHPVVKQFIIDCLRYWVLEMHVDGFRFDLASILYRGRDGRPLDPAPIVEAITEDPILASTKLIAEPWDAVGLYDVGRFVPKEQRWSEWNDKYRDSVRRFIKGTPAAGIKGEFISRLSGSEDLYYSRSPLSSINFITAHDGFTLNDLVSYNEKHNEENGEQNRDGNSKNDSWNCGAEGQTNDQKVIRLRERQKRNFHLAMMVSQGVPMILMGDEYAHTKKGNNNTWSHDNELNWFLWDELPKHEGFGRFYRKMIQIRKQHKLLRRETFLSKNDVQWHGVEPLKPEWDSPVRYIAFTLLDEDKGEDLYVAFNSMDQDLKVKLPEPRNGKKWHWIVNTANASPDDFFDQAPPVESLEVNVPSFSAFVLKALTGYKS